MQIQHGIVAIWKFVNTNIWNIVVSLDVVDGVPQGIVLGPLLFLLHTNDSSKVRLFADDCLI